MEVLLLLYLMSLSDSKPRPTGQALDPNVLRGMSPWVVGGTVFVLCFVLFGVIAYFYAP